MYFTETFLYLLPKSWPIILPYFFTGFLVLEVKVSNDNVMPFIKMKRLICVAFNHYRTICVISPFGGKTEMQLCPPFLSLTCSLEFEIH